MRKQKIKNYKKGPEAKIQEAVIKMLRERGWFVKVLHGNLFQSGMPDLFICQRRYGSRFVEIKNPEAYSFTSAQWETFPRLIAEGVGVWILVAATEIEYQKLFQKPNLWIYMGGYDK